MIAADHLFRIGPQIGVKLGHMPVVPHLMGIGTVGTRLGKMGIDVLAHCRGQFGRQEIVHHPNRRARLPDPQFLGHAVPRRHSGASFHGRRRAVHASRVRGASKKPAGGAGGSVGKGLVASPRKAV